MNLENLKKEADKEDDNNKKLSKLKFQILNLSKNYEDVKIKISLIIKKKREEKKEIIKKDFEDYFIKSGFTIKNSNCIGLEKIYAVYKNIKIELELGEEYFQINYKEKEIYQSFDIDLIEDSTYNQNNIEGWTLYNNYLEDIRNIDTIDKAEKLIDYLKNEVDSLNNIDTLDKINFRYKYFKSEKYSDSLYEILENIFNNDN